MPLDCMNNNLVHIPMYKGLLPQRQTAVTAYFISEQLLLFVFEHSPHTDVQGTTGVNSPLSVSTRGRGAYPLTHNTRFPAWFHFAAHVFWPFTSLYGIVYPSRP